MFLHAEHAESTTSNTVGSGGNALHSNRKACIQRKALTTNRPQSSQNSTWKDMICRYWDKPPEPMNSLVRLKPGIQTLHGLRKSASTRSAADHGACPWSLRPAKSGHLQKASANMWDIVRLEDKGHSSLKGFIRQKTLKLGESEELKPWERKQSKEKHVFRL